MQKENWFKLDLFHWDFLSSLVKGLWFYICKHYGGEAKMPETKVVFMTERAREEKGLSPCEFSQLF